MSQKGPFIKLLNEKVGVGVRWKLALDTFSKWISVHFCLQRGGGKYVIFRFRTLWKISKNVLWRILRSFIAFYWLYSLKKWVKIVTISASYLCNVTMIEHFAKNKKKQQQLVWTIRGLTLHSNQQLKYYTILYYIQIRNFFKK